MSEIRNGSQTKLYGSSNILAYCYPASHAFAARIPRVTVGCVPHGPETSNEPRWLRADQIKKAIDGGKDTEGCGDDSVWRSLH
jgi:hypothetical protein